mgnify:CR=1 FL=1
MTRWLSLEQQRIWRDWITAAQLLEDVLTRELQDAFDMTLSDYEILVRLSESPQRRIRMSELAASVISSRSRLSHQIDRMVSNGLVERQVCDDDRRGQFAVLTNKGMELLEAAAPTHVTGVREHFVDVLTPEEYEALGRAVEKLAAHLDEGNEISKIK